MSPASAASCSAVTHGTLAEVVASPGLILVADVIAIRDPGTPDVDRLPVQEVIRPEVPDQGLDLRAGVLIMPSNECWQGLRAGDRIVAIFPYPDGGLVAGRSVAWRISGSRVEQVSHQDVTGVPTSASALIEALRRLGARAPDAATALPEPDPSPRRDGTGGFVALVFYLSVGLASSILVRRARRDTR